MDGMLNIFNVLLIAFCDVMARSTRAHVLMHWDIRACTPVIWEPKPSVSSNSTPVVLSAAITHWPTISVIAGCDHGFSNSFSGFSRERKAVNPEQRRLQIAGSRQRA